MKKGKEPMRTFGDLRQFFEVAKGPTKESAEKNSDALPTPKAPGLRPGEHETSKPSHLIPAHESEPTVAAADRIVPVANPDPLPTPAGKPAEAKVEDSGEYSQ